MVVMVVVVFVDEYEALGYDDDQQLRFLQRWQRRVFGPLKGGHALRHQCFYQELMGLALLERGPSASFRTLF